MGNEFDKTLYDLIKAQYQLNNDYKTAFNNICQHFNYKPLPTKIYKKWFKSMDNKKFYFYYHEKYQKHYIILMKIYELYFKFDHPLLWNKENGIDKEFVFLPDNPRYGIKCSVKNGKLIGLELIDYFHGKIRLV